MPNTNTDDDTKLGYKRFIELQKQIYLETGDYGLDIESETETIVTEEEDNA